MSNRTIVGLVLLLASLGIAILGCLVGGLNISGVEPPPEGYFINCGPAVFGRISPLPHPACGQDMSKLVILCWLLIALGVLGAMGSSVLLVRGRLVRS